MNNKGFTLIELVMIIVLLSLLAVVAIPQIGNFFGSMRQSNAAMKIASDIRSAQNMATTTRQRSQVRFVTATNYDIFFCATVSQCPCTLWNLVSQVNLNNDFPNVTISSSVTNLEFDSLGRPYDGTSCVNSTGATVTIQYPGEGNKFVTVQPQTGMVAY